MGRDVDSWLTPPVFDSLRLDPRHRGLISLTCALQNGPRPSVTELEGGASATDVEIRPTNRRQQEECQDESVPHLAEVLFGHPLITVTITVTGGTC